MKKIFFLLAALLLLSTNSPAGSDPGKEFQACMDKCKPPVLKKTSNETDEQWRKRLGQEIGYEKCRNRCEREYLESRRRIRSYHHYK